MAQMGWPPAADQGCLLGQRFWDFGLLWCSPYFHQAFRGKNLTLLNHKNHSYNFAHHVSTCSLLPLPTHSSMYLSNHPCSYMTNICLTSTVCRYQIVEQRPWLSFFFPLTGHLQLFSITRARLAKGPSNARRKTVYACHQEEAKNFGSLVIDGPIMCLIVSL